MDRLLRSRLGSNLTLIAASAAVPAAVMHFLVSEEAAPVTATQHLLIMAFGSIVAAASSAALMSRASAGARPGRSWPAARSRR